MLQVELNASADYTCGNGTPYSEYLVHHGIALQEFSTDCSIFG